jgi:hypothetical protein
LIHGLTNEMFDYRAMHRRVCHCHTLLL